MKRESRSAATKAKIIATAAENARKLAMVDKLLAHCPDAECAECSRIVCPHGDSMHFHHDGCPSCYAEDMEANPPVRPEDAR